MNNKIKLTLLCGLIFLLVSASFLMAEKWYNLYETGLADIKDGNWNSAIENIKKALEEKPVPKLNSRTVAVRFIDYLPYYHLGLAHYKMGNYAEAKKMLDRSQRYKVISNKVSLSIKLSDMLADCNKKLQPTAIKKEPVKPIKTTGKAALIKVSYQERR